MKGKRSQRGLLRQASQTEEETDSDLSPRSLKLQKKPPSKTQIKKNRRAEVEEEALRIAEKRKKSRKKNPLDAITETVTFAASPRDQALFQRCAALDDRSLSAFMRRAAHFYIQQHGLI